jgi:hypothetical protein
LVQYTIRNFVSLSAIRWLFFQNSCSGQAHSSLFVDRYGPKNLAIADVRFPKRKLVALDGGKLSVVASPPRYFIVISPSTFPIRDQINQAARKNDSGDHQMVGWWTGSQPRTFENLACHQLNLAGNVPRAGGTG